MNTLLLNESFETKNIQRVHEWYKTHIIILT